MYFNTGLQALLHHRIFLERDGGVLRDAALHFEGEQAGCHSIRVHNNEVVMMNSDIVIV
jgi:hypothetical protein